MSRTTVTHPDGSQTVIRRSSGCGGCPWALLGLFVLVAPAAWASAGTIPLAVAVLMYCVEAALLGLWLRQRVSAPHQ